MTAEPDASSPEDLWALIRSELARAVDESTFRIWLEPLRPLEIGPERVLLASPARTRDWVRDRFGRVLQTSAAAVLGPEVSVDLTVADGVAHEAHPQPSAAPRSPAASSHRRGTSPPFPPAPAALDRHSGTPALNPRLTFEQFVIGDSNRLAHAAALTVAEMPAQAYNPLFIYGPPGLGKTHLLHSIATYVATHGGGMTVRYTTGEAFTTEFLSALNGGSLDGFKARFRHLDVLLIDDVQFLERKARTEEEFFHTFNALSDIGSQLVITSDRMPRDLAALEDRLRERFEAGLVADIRAPDLATRLTILRKRVHQEGVALTDPDTLHVIAERVALNVRALEGALTRVIAYSSLTNLPLTPGLAQGVMDNLYPQAVTGPRTIADIRVAAGALFGVSEEEMLSASRSARIAWARQVAMYLAREMTESSLPAIGREFGGRDHSTVLYACRRAERRIADDDQARAAVDSLRQLLAGGPAPARAPAS